MKAQATDSQARGRTEAEEDFDGFGTHAQSDDAA